MPVGILRSSDRRDEMITDILIVICSSIVVIFIPGMFVTEWTRDCQHKRLMREAAISEENNQATIRVVEPGRSRARRVPRFNSLPGK